MLSRNKSKFKKKEEEYLKYLFKHCPEAKQANELALRYKGIIVKEKVKLLSAWIEDAIESGKQILKGFAKNMLKDYDAIYNACSLKWSNGQVEGQVNRLKNIKRQMYGRANFELLKRKVLSDTS